MPGARRRSSPAPGLPQPQHDPSSGGRPFCCSSPQGPGERDTVAPSTPLFSPTAPTGVRMAAIERKEGQSSRNQPTQEARPPGQRQTNNRLGQKETQGAREPDRRRESGKNRLSRSRGAEEEGSKNGEDPGGCQMGREGGAGVRRRDRGGRRRERGTEEDGGTQDPADLNLKLKPGWGREAEKITSTLPWRKGSPPLEVSLRWQEVDGGE